MFDNSVFKRSTETVRMQNAKLRAENQFPDHTLMIVQPQHCRDMMRIPDVFRIDPLRRSDRKIQSYRNLLAGIAAVDESAPQVISLQHQNDLKVFSPMQIGLKCCFITEVRNEDGSYFSQTCDQFAARFQAHCPKHSMAVSIQERKMYSGFASADNDSDDFHDVHFGTKVQIKLPNLNKEGFRHQAFTVAYQSVHKTYHRIEEVLREFGRYHRVGERIVFNNQFESKFTLNVKIFRTKIHIKMLKFKIF